MNKILSLPLRALRRIAATIMGRNTAPPADPPPPPRRTARPKPPPPPAPGEDHGHDHGHSHDHGHDHGHAEPAPAPAEDHGHGHDHGHAEPAPAPAEDHGHSHDHGHAEPAPAEKPKKAPAKKKSGAAVRSEETPNPNARKYVVGQKVVEKGSLSFNSAAEAKGHALGTALFAVKGVASVFAVNDFVTVTRKPSVEWDVLDAAVIAAITGAL